ncbi:Sec-independent protein translocase protein TatB [Acinetobacter rudis]|uniref:Sec-independent protein translocase protein TatB n=1 Tax=Acinetobacter rudis TaxID=632955 RepID=A0AAW8JBY1_9GAMM|nr:Sec-independent protein translocase protein TatB [Acinetobacter rudis]MDQ8936626.1 Sec-independent protein translocase protein TatB [Acinetobacter rudis]MDQ8954378.1 Sec-independent protein translocase protein TatB [Acinetobacter rudis]MDQ9016946.1 Sec-independent protein translocase protein TatB [Acinetobacter rudis]
MLDVGFSELLVFGVIALLVLGPEKLPEAARFAAKWYSKFKRAISSVQNDIDRELRLSELREQMNQEMKRIQELEEKMQRQMQELQQQANQPLTSEHISTTSVKHAQYQYVQHHIPKLYMPTLWLKKHNCNSVLVVDSNPTVHVPEFQVAV